MPTIEHSQLTDPDLHEPRGASTAVASRVYVSDGLGSGSWQQVPLTALAPTAQAFEGQLFTAYDVQASGTHAGTFPNATWVQRTLTHVTNNDIAGASLALNSITLPAGTYWIDCTVPAYQVDGHLGAWHNLTDNVDHLYGTTETAGASDSVLTRSRIFGRITIAAPKVFAVRHKCTTTRATSGLGVASGGPAEIYTTVNLWKVG